MKNIVLVFSALLLFVVFNTSAKNPSENKPLDPASGTPKIISLDSHYHLNVYDYRDQKGISTHSKIEAAAHLRRFTTKNGIQSSFLITESYSRCGQDSSLESCFKINEAASDIILKSSGTNFGLCGIPDKDQSMGVEIAMQCQKLKGFIGFKFHHGDSCMVEGDISRKTFEKILSTINMDYAVILIHPGNSTMLNCDPVEVMKYYYKVSQIYQRFDFILAHAALSKGLKWVGEQYESDKSRAQNMFTEISPGYIVRQWRIRGENGTFTDYNYFDQEVERYKSTMEDLKVFGIERVLFGTDNVSPHLEVEKPEGDHGNVYLQTSALDALKYYSGWTLKEQHQILWENGAKFLERIKQRTEMQGSSK